MVKVNLKVIKFFFQTYDFNTNEITLNNGEIIKDLKHMVSTHVKILESQTGQKGFTPYWNRLKKCYEICKKNELT